MKPRIAILGASGLIGYALATDLLSRGYELRAFARKFTDAQKSALRDLTTAAPLVALGKEELSYLLDECSADIVINCIGVLQDAPDGTTDAVHCAFANKLAAHCALPPKKLLVQLSVPGNKKSDPTSFSRTKHFAEDAIASSDAPFVIIRPGFVIAPTAYGGSAMMRSLAALPIRLGSRESNADFAAVAIEDLCKTLAFVVEQWRAGVFDWSCSWDVMDESPGSIGDLLEAMRLRCGGPTPFLRLPALLMWLGGLTGDAVSWLGWRSPVRTTAVREMLRGITGNPAPWMAATGIKPLSAQAALARVPFTVQEKWFAHLYLLKSVAIATLVLFWCVSGLIALTVSADAASDVLIAHGFSMPIARFVAIASSIVDIFIGCAIAVRWTCRVGLVAGIGVCLFYLLSAVILAPELWIDPLGPLVKIVPVVILMIVCLAILEDR